MNVRLRFLIFSIVCLLICETEETIQHLNNNQIIQTCTKCAPGWGVAKRCTRDSDTVCVRCTQGRTYSSHHSSKSRCWSCSRCGVGLYESHRCTPIGDTICNECTSYLDNKNLTSNIDFLTKCSYIFLN